MKISFKQHGHLLAGYLRPQWPRVLLLAALILGHIGLQLVNPQIVRTFIDTAQAGGALGKLTGTALLFLGVAVAGQGLDFGFRISDFGFRIANRTSRVSNPHSAIPNPHSPFRIPQWERSRCWRR